MTKRRRTDADYEADADYYAVHPPVATDPGTIEFGPGHRPHQATRQVQGHEE